MQAAKVAGLYWVDPQHNQTFEVVGYTIKLLTVKTDFATS